MHTNFNIDSRNFQVSKIIRVYDLDKTVFYASNQSSFHYRKIAGTLKIININLHTED